MALATLSIDLVAQLANLQQGMDKAGRLADKNAAQIEARYQKVQGALVGIGAALGAAFSVSQITQFFRTTVDGLDALNDLADSTGASIENLSALEDIAARTGTQMGTVGDAVIKLNKALGEAKPGSDIAAAFKALGLNAEELKRIDPAEALRQVAVALSGYADDGNKARVVQELFGKSLKEVAPLLKDLAEAGKLNGTVTREQAQAAETFNKQLSALQKNITDVARDLSGPLLSALNKFFQELANARTAYGSVTGGVLDNFRFGATGTINGDLLDSARKIGEIRRTIERADAGQTKPLFADQRKALLDEVALLEKRERFLRLQQKVQGGGRGDEINPGFAGAKSLPDLRTDKPGKAAPDKAETFTFKLDETTAAALKRLENTDAQKIAALRLELQALIELRASTGAGSVDEAILEVEEALAKLSPQAQAAAAAAERLNAILAQTPTNQMQAVLADIELINRAFEGAPEKAEQWAEAIRVATASLSKGTEEATVQISDFAQQAARNIQDALGDTVLNTLQGKTEDIETLWKNMLLRLVSQAIAADLGKALLGNFGGTGQIGGLLGSLGSFIFGGARAGGGPVSPGRAYLVGERGPEIVVPRAAGTVVPNHAMGGTSVTVNVAAGVTRGEVTAAVQLGMQTAEANMMQRLRAARVL
jgi:hypothetical protein